jgi:hypothetical protein
VKNKLSFYAMMLVAMILMSIGADAQVASGGSFELEKTSIAGGGGESSGGTFTVNGTTGQAAAGARSNDTAVRMQNGFWTGIVLAPTAGHAIVSGRILTVDGRGIKNVRLTLIGPHGVAGVATSTTFGYFRIPDVPVGQTYILTVSSKRYTFSNPQRVFTVTDDLAEIDFVAEE